METEPKRKRRWYQFSLSTLFVVTLFVAIWALGMRVIGEILDSDEAHVARFIGWAELTIAMLAGICVFMRAAVRHHESIRPGDNRLDRE